LLSTGKRPFFHWGHVWVVVSIAVPAFGKTWALPVLFRLYRSKKRCRMDRRPYRKCPELAAELIKMLADALPERHIVVVGDSAYTNGSVIRGRPKNVTIVGRC
jgi:SRSO17 transposase